MDTRNSEELLGKLAEVTGAEQPSAGLAERIKQQIPHSLAAHRRPMDTVNIMIDLRISRFAAAAVIIISIVLAAHLLGRRDIAGEGVYHDLGLLVKYCLTDEDPAKNETLAGMSGLCQYLRRQGKEVVYYGDSFDLTDSNDILMQWKLTDGNYQVMFADLRTETITAEQLIKLQSEMLLRASK